MPPMLTLLAAVAAAVLIAAHIPARAHAQAVPVADAQGRAIVAAATAFLDALSPEQREAALYGWTDDAQRANWSNFPIDMEPRGGVPWGEMDKAQRAALMTLLGTVLSERGVRMVTEQMAADDVLAAEAGGGGPDLTFGSDYYYASILGEPSDTAPWMLQFGGHHLAINATVVGPDLTLAPSLTGGQPLRFEMAGREVWIVEEEVTEALALMASLTDEQRDVAVRGRSRIDLVLGPGQDGRTLQPEGLPASAMTDAQQALLLALIEARLGIVNADDLAARMVEVEAGLDETTFAWWGRTAEPPLGGLGLLDGPAESYWRVTGPTLVLEFSPQDLGGDASQHAHNMLRDPGNDYGAAWAPGP